MIGLSALLLIIPYRLRFASARMVWLPAAGV